MDEIGKKFAANLRAYIDRQPYGIISKLAEILKVDQSTISNWAAGRRKSTELQRRKVADAIKIEYDVLVGLPKEDCKTKYTQQNQIAEPFDFFEQKSLVREINEDLLHLEKLNKKELIEVHEFIKFRLHKQKKPIASTQKAKSPPEKNQEPTKV